ncbi:MAG TPA: hypothetical protein VMW73_14775 [Spirochaetia bacterium]|nr:hypothetical protein [Spirochaetia bacterium]
MMNDLVLVAGMIVWIEQHPVDPVSSEAAMCRPDRQRSIRDMREASMNMKIANLEQPPFAATLMGCLKGASDYFGLDSSPAMLYGLTGHAFLINMNAELEPSSPYVWMKSRFIQLLEGCGIRFTTHYDMLTNDTPESERAAVERELKSAMQAEKLCMVNFLEHQLVAGYDGDGFNMLQPWNGTAFSEIKSLSFGTWDQCLKEAGWVSFTVLARSEKRTPIRQAVRDAIAYAYELFYNPIAYQAPGYRIGEGAYDNWIAGVKRGLGTGHGHW